MEEVTGTAVLNFPYWVRTLILCFVVFPGIFVGLGWAITEATKREGEKKYTGWAMLTVVMSLVLIFLMMDSDGSKLEREDFYARCDSAGGEVMFDEGMRDDTYMCIVDGDVVDMEVM